jgi:hypothetical protein
MWSKLCQKMAVVFDASDRMVFLVSRSKARMLFVVLFTLLDQSTDRLARLKVAVIGDHEL